jgi:predicted ATPase/DNA-binding CsgD family transcriptional regulator
MSSSDRTARAAAELDTVLGNLPVQLTKLLGREDTLSELRPLVWRTRLLTLCGPGGAGKSRLGIALAEAVRDDFIGGAWWADLSASVDPSLVAQAVAAAILPGEQANNPAAAIARQLNAASLLVLDNCDQVVAGCAELVIDLLARAPALRIVVTSRQALGVPGELQYRVSGLMIEDSRSALESSEVGGDAGGGAIALFMRRAQDAAGTFSPDSPGTRAAVSQICQWLDGMPLAIELAAARVTVLSVTQIAERLKRDSDLLRHTGRGTPERHRTLQDTLEWSHQLLEGPERRLFRRLGSFRTSFTLAAAEAIGADELLAADDVLDLLSMLINQSLVQVLDGPDQPRYRLLATIRQYAVRKLESSGELEATVTRHAQFFAELGQQARAGLAGADLVRWLEHLELEHDNLSEALQWLFGHAPAQAAELASGLWPFSYQHGYYSQARSWFEQALACDQLSVAARIDALLKAGEVAFLQCEYPVAISHLQTALALIGEAGDRRAQAIALQRLGSIAREQGRYEQSRAQHEQSMAIWESLADREGVASSQNYLGFIAWLAGDFQRAESLGLEALAEFRRAGNLRDAVATLISLGAAALYRGEPDLAAQRLEEALAISRRLGFQEGIAWSLHELAILARRRRRPSREPALMLRDALLAHQQLGDRWRTASVLEEIAASVLARQDAALAVQVLACSQALRELIGTAIPPAEAPDRDAALSRLRRQLSAGAFERAWAQGRAQEPRDAITLSVRAIEELVADDASVERMAPILTPRELAVLELLAQGHTNREIAAALYISPSTAGVHVSNILRKLRAKRRVDAAGLAHTLGLIPTH